MPLLDDKTIAEVLEYYPTTNYTGPEYETNGLGGPGATVLDVSEFNEGQQQRASDLYAEVCQIRD